MTKNHEHQHPSGPAATAIGHAHHAPTADELAAWLRAAGQRVTPQRLVILGAFRGPGEHLSADEVFARVGPLIPAVNRSTVYRTLELFRDLGLISETDLGGGVRHYERIDDSRHHHLICQQCGVMIDLVDTDIQPLREVIQKRYQFAPIIDHLALFGLCSYCQAHPPTAPSGDDADAT